jgi:hypothetical protein
LCKKVVGLKISSSSVEKFRGKQADKSTDTTDPICIHFVYHTMKTCGGGELRLHAFLNLRVELGREYKKI